MLANVDKKEFNILATVDITANSIIEVNVVRFSNA